MRKTKRAHPTTEVERLDHFKRLVVAAMFSDKELNQRFVLKGGNAIDILLQVGTRASTSTSCAAPSQPRKLPSIFSPTLSPIAIFTGPTFRL